MNENEKEQQMMQQEEAAAPPPKKKFVPVQIEVVDRVVVPGKSQPHRSAKGDAKRAFSVSGKRHGPRRGDAPKEVRRRRRHELADQRREEADAALTRPLVSSASPSPVHAFGPGEFVDSIASGRTASSDATANPPRADETGGAS